MSFVNDWKSHFHEQFRLLQITDGEQAALLSRDASAITQFRHLHQLPLASAGLVITPRTPEDISAIIRLAIDNNISVIARGGGSGVMQGIVPDPHSIILDLSRLTNIGPLNSINGHITVEAGVNGLILEQHIAAKGWTLGHWPQSLAMASLGGLVSTKSIGQYSTRYGGIEDMVRQIDVVTGTGERYHIGHHSPRRTAGPELLPLFFGSEGTLGIITAVTLKIFPLPEGERGLSVVLPNFDQGLELMRQWIQRGITPSVLRLYDPAETTRTFPNIRSGAVLIALFHGFAELITVLYREAQRIALDFGSVGDDSTVLRWVQTKNDVSAWTPLLKQGFLVDTIEVSGTWSQLATIYRAIIEAVSAHPGVLGITGHSSHAYSDGANLYFTFIAQPTSIKAAPSLYEEIWACVMNATIHEGGSIGHHHGVGRTRRPWMKAERGDELNLMKAIRPVFDPHGILNRGVLWP